MSDSPTVTYAQIEVLRKWREAGGRLGVGRTVGSFDASIALDDILAANPEPPQKVSTQGDPYVTLADRCPAKCGMHQCARRNGHDGYHASGTANAGLEWASSPEPPWEPSEEDVQAFLIGNDWPTSPTNWDGARRRIIAGRMGGWDIVPRRIEPPEAS